MTKSRALGFATCHKQELFVAQELINEVKSKCCGIKATFAMSLMILLVLICSTKVSEKSDMAKS